MTYKDIDGWFYDEVATKLNNNSIIVEVGVWQGKSIIYLAEAFKKLGKSPTIIAVDTWLGSNLEEHDNKIKKLGGPNKLFVSL